jgi:hypothetical protein
MGRTSVRWPSVLFKACCRVTVALLLVVALLVVVALVVLLTLSECLPFSLSSLSELIPCSSREEVDLVLRQMGKRSMT